MDSNLTQIVIAIITAIVSITVARVQAGKTGEKKATEVVNNGFGTEIRKKIASLQELVDLQAKRLDRFTVVMLERDEYKSKAHDLEQEIAGCTNESCPLVAARKAKAGD